jgi:hypothetical protein
MFLFYFISGLGGWYRFLTDTPPISPSWPEPPISSSLFYPLRQHP